MKRFLLLLLFSSSFLMGQSQPQQSQSQESPPQKPPFVLKPWEKLQTIETAHFDPALPPRHPFGRWFRRLVVPAVPEYEQRDCDSAATPASSDAPKPQCIFVTVALPPGRLLSLKFTFDAEHNSFDYAEGTIGPKDPRSKQPTRLIKKLSELPAIVHPEGQGS